MASGGDVTDEQLIEKFKEFSIASGAKNPTQFTPKANGKFVECLLKPKYGKYQVGNISDASVFPTCKPKTQQYMDINQESVTKYVSKISLELAKRKASPVDAKTLTADSPATKAVESEVRQAIATGSIKKKQTATSKTGNVTGLTDTSKYTGSHKERFDETGKGRGKDGRVEKKDDSGYVANYKGKDTFDAKK